VALRCIHLLQKSVFLYEESGEVEELKPDELQRNMRALTDVTFDQWCASSQRRAYDKDVFVPTLVPAQQNSKHYNRFKGLDTQYKDCCEVDVSACEPLLAHIREILCNGNEAATEFVLKTFARIIQGVEKGHLHWIKSQITGVHDLSLEARLGQGYRHASLSADSGRLERQASVQEERCFRKFQRALHGQTLGRTRRTSVGRQSRAGG
jgi:hypothetical protein